MDKIIKLLIASKILDDDKTLSLSSVLMLVLIVKVALTPTMDWSTISALFLALLSYNSRKLIRLKAAKQTATADDQVKSTFDAHAAQITHLTSQVSQLVSASSVNSVMNQMLGR